MIGVGVLVLLLERADHPGYVYDELGRNTLIPAVDAPNPTNGNITLAYNSTDDVTSINQGSSTTTFSYDTQTRRLNETNNTVTTTRHYTDSTDNPSWVTQNGSNPKTEIYTPSLGTGLNITTTIQGTTKTADIQLQDLRGNTVTTVDLTTNTATGWNSYDEFGNPQKPTNNTNLINYTTYAKAERATNTTGLILMGARVYNPKTNQFTAPDPITGGNENTYNYPNDPINNQDFSGQVGFWQWSAIAFAVNLIPAMLVGAICGSTAGALCPIAATIASVFTGFLQEFIITAIETGNTVMALKAGLKGAFFGAIGGALLGKVFGFTDKMISGKLVMRIFGHAIRAFKTIVDIAYSGQIGEAVIRAGVELAKLIIPSFKPKN